MKAFIDGRWTEIEERRLVKDYLLFTEKTWRWVWVILIGFTLGYFFGGLLR